MRRNLQSKAAHCPNAHIFPAPIEPSRNTSYVNLRLSELAQIAEIIAAVAVIFSLLYVGMEVRRYTAATQAATYQEVVQASNEYLLALARDAELTEIVLKAETEAVELTDAEGRRYFSYIRAFWRNMENAFVQHQRGVLADSEWEVYRGIACGVRTNGPFWSWSLHSSDLSPDFVKLMDEC